VNARALVVLVLALSPAALAAQEPDVRAMLVARGMTPVLAESIAVVARETSGRGMSSQPVVDKAVEGWFKHVPPPRILAAVRDLSGRMDQVRTELRGAGLAEVDGSVIGAAAESRAQGIARGDQVDIIRAARGPTAASAGLSVSAALVVQGIDARTSARLVVESFRRGRSASQVLDLPAAARALQMRGTPTSEVGRDLLEGMGHGGGGDDGGESGGDHGGRTKPRSPLIPPRPDN
jgi:hypothetical protein